MGKNTISMAIFHCYVSSPEGIFHGYFYGVINHKWGDWISPWLGKGVWPIFFWQTMAKRTSSYAMPWTIPPCSFEFRKNLRSGQIAKTKALAQLEITGTCFGMIPPLLLTIICGAWLLYFTRAGQDLARLPDGDVEHEAESIHQKWLRFGTLGFQHNKIYVETKIYLQNGLRWELYSIGSMVLLYMVTLCNIYHPYTPVMLAYIPAPWIRHGY